MTENVLPYDFISKVARSLREEEEDIYLLMLYSLNSSDMDYFNESDRVRVKNIFKVLMDDTKRHADILRLIVDLGSR